MGYSSQGHEGIRHDLVTNIFWEMQLRSEISFSIEPEKEFKNTRVDMGEEYGEEAEKKEEQQKRENFEEGSWGKVRALQPALKHLKIPFPSGKTEILKHYLHVYVGTC